MLFLRGGKTISIFVNSIPFLNNLYKYRNELNTEALMCKQCKYTNRQHSFHVSKLSRAEPAVLIETMHLFVSGRFVFSIFYYIWECDWPRLLCSVVYRSCIALAAIFLYSQQSMTWRKRCTSQSRTQQKDEDETHQVTGQKWRNLNNISDQTIVVGWNGCGRVVAVDILGEETVAVRGFISFIANFCNVFMANLYGCRKNNSCNFKLKLLSNLLIGVI